MPSYYNGKIINGYEIIECLTSGEYATSYKAKKGGKVYFFKEYIDPVESAPNFKAFVQQQNKINERLCSRKLRCLERLLDSFIINYRYHQVKEFLNCVDLFDYLKKDFDLDNRLWICRLWLGILREISGANVIHHDLKPQQVLMVKDAGVKLGHRMIFADFDWAVIDGNMVKSVCTPGYASPEHMKGIIPTVASDLYQTGVVLYEILTGRLPFYNDCEFYDAEIACERMEKADFILPHILQPVVPKWASDIICAMLVWEPSSRIPVEDAVIAWDRKSLSAPSRPIVKGALVTPAKTTTKPAAPLPSKVPAWIRLRHDSGANMSFSANETLVTRQLFHGPFKQVMTTSGHPIAAYFPSDDKTPFFTIRKDSDCWKTSGSDHRNHCLLNGAKLETKTLMPIKQGDILEIYGEKESKVVGKFTFEVPL
jgi:serine/threonine protein kinase